MKKLCLRYSPCCACAGKPALSASRMTSPFSSALLMPVKHPLPTRSAPTVMPLPPKSKLSACSTPFTPLKHAMLPPDTLKTANLKPPATNINHSRVSPNAKKNWFIMNRAYRFTASAPKTTKKKRLKSHPIPKTTKRLTFKLFCRTCPSIQSG